MDKAKAEEMAQETDRVTYLGSAAKMMLASLYESPLFKDAVLICISVVPAEDGDILNMVTNAGPKATPYILEAALQKARTSPSKLMDKPQ